MAFDVEAARADGYTDEEIQQYLSNKDQPLPPDQPRERGEEALGIAQAVGADMLPAVATGLATGVGGFVGYQGLKYAAPRVADAVRNMTGGGVPAVGSPANPIGTPAGPGAQRIPIQTGPVAPASIPSAPAPAATPAPAAQSPSVMQRGMDYARQMQRIAAEKVMQNAGTIGRASVGAAAALTPGNVGQNYNFPTSGRFAGQEINPMTGRPWTPQEIAQVQ